MQYLHLVKVDFHPFEKKLTSVLTKFLRLPIHKINIMK